IYYMSWIVYKFVFNRVGVGVIFIGLNDVGNLGYYGIWESAADTVLIMFNNHIKNWIIGFWIIVKPLPGDERVSGVPGHYNEAMDRIGDGIDTAYLSVSNV